MLITNLLYKAQHTKQRCANEEGVLWTMPMRLLGRCALGPDKPPEKPVRDCVVCWEDRAAGTDMCAVGLAHGAYTAQYTN